MGNVSSVLRYAENATSVLNNIKIGLVDFAKTLEVPNELWQLLPYWGNVKNALSPIQDMRNYIH